jgi:hypothetical protein
MQAPNPSFERTHNSNVRCHKRVLVAMKRYIYSFALAALLLFAWSAPAHAVEVAAEYKCTDRLDPEAMVKGFLQRGFIQSPAYAENDSITYFKSGQRFTAFGFPLVAVAAFKEDSAYFNRAPGTSPGNRFALVVQAPEGQVLGVVHKKGLSIAGIRDLRYPALRIEPFSAEPLPKGSIQSLPYTQILCLPKV